MTKKNGRIAQEAFQVNTVLKIVIKKEIETNQGVQTLQNGNLCYFENVFSLKEREGAGGVVQMLSKFE